jgi:molybdate transport system ATP-binding protein
VLSVAIRRQLTHFALDIAFRVPAGRTVLFGPSGAGKSLTLQAIAGLVPLEWADIRLGATVWHASDAGIILPPQARRTGYLPQDYALFPHLTVAQNIAFGQRRRGKVAGKRVAELLALMHLEGLEGVYPARLSGGQQQRVALARALASEPQLLLLDEPWSALDGPVRAALRAEIQRFYEQVGVPLVLVTHDAQDAQVLADTVVVIERGRVLQTGSPEAVFRAPRTSHIATLVGLATHWQGCITACVPAAPQGWLVTIQVAHLTLHALQPAESTLQVGQDVTAGILPDEIILLAGGQHERKEQAAVLVEATVRQAQMRGTFPAVTVHLGGELYLDIPVPRWQARTLQLAAGTRLQLSIPCAAVHLFIAQEPAL